MLFLGFTFFLIIGAATGWIKNESAKVPATLEKSGSKNTYFE